MALWNEREPGEGPKAWAAFTIYRDLGADRSITQAWRKATNRTEGESRRWEQWASQFRWVDRAAAYDAHVDELQRQAREYRLVKLAERRADYEFRVQEYLEDCVERVRVVIEKLCDLPPTDIERVEDKDITVKESGAIEVRTVKTRIRGVKPSGLARLTDAYEDRMRAAVVGVRGNTAEPIGAGAAKALLPDFMLEFIERERAEHAAVMVEYEASKKELTDGSNPDDGGVAEY